jgi:phosphinothricin acetyltransferase
MPISVRLARAEDGDRVSAIYRPAVVERATSFELDAPDATAMSTRITDCLEKLPWLIAEDEGRVLGYAYASPHRARAAYQWSVDVSAYVHGEAHRHGIGRALYCGLFRILQLQGYVNAYAGITTPNEASERFHQAMGFTPIGVYRGVGYKLGAWHDVVWLERSLAPRDRNPPLPIPLSSLMRTSLVSAAIRGDPTPRLRAATLADVPALGALMAASVRELSVGFYSPAQVESALQHLLGTDTQLITDGTYYVADVAGQIAAAGGWSRRFTMHGGDQAKRGPDPLIDPAADPARLRAFFVHPRWARRGLATLLFHECSLAARAAGFRAFQLTATLPGEPLYGALGFEVIERGAVPLPGGLELGTARMRRLL